MSAWWNMYKIEKREEALSPCAGRGIIYPHVNWLHDRRTGEARLSPSRKRSKRQSNRSAQIITIGFSIIVVLSVVLGLIGPFTFGRSDEPTPIPTRVFPTAAPLPTITPTPNATPTTDVPTPVMITPTTGP